MPLRLLLSIVLLTPFGIANAGDYAAHAKLPLLLQTLQQQEGFNQHELNWVRQSLSQAKRIPALIQAEQKSAEKTENWTQYAAKRVDPRRISLGADFIGQHRHWLLQAEAEYGVPAAVIAGVLGLETNYGGFTGNARVLDSLATQGFDHPRRSRFFFSELVNFFAFCKEFGLDPTTLKGSYAGAMGWAQFMPSNYRRLSLDYDGDGRRDLWTAADAIGSIARYLVEYDRKRSWVRGQPLAVRATLSRPVAASVARNKKNTTHSVDQLRALGVKPAVSLPGHLRAGLVELDVDGGKEYWIGLHNFYAVMSYNPRVLYAMTVTRLAQEIEKQSAQRASAS
ncbi:MAG: lytic murein transglycosylase B [Panacagrimonas sp.]